MASWWTADDVLDDLDLDLEQNPIVTRVIQAVGLFGDILSLEDTMETVLSADGQGSSSEEEEGSGRAGEERAGGCQDERVMAEEERGHSETFKHGGMGERVIEGDNPGENGEMEKRKVEEEEENKGWEEHNEGDKTRMSVTDAREEEEDRKKQGREEDKRDEVKETDEEQVETKEQQSKEERKDEELMTLEKENQADTEGMGDEEAEEKGEMTQEQEVLKEERKDGRKHECDKHGDEEEEEEELDKKKEGEKNKAKGRRKMEKEQLDEGEETMATQASRKEKANDARLDGGETKLDPNQLEQTSNPPAEVHHGNAHETGSEALSGDGDEGWDAAQDRDVCPESESVDKQPETTAGSVAALRDPTAASVTSLPAGRRHSNKEAGGPRGDVAPDLQPGNQNLHFHHFTSSNPS